MYAGIKIINSKRRNEHLKGFFSKNFMVIVGLPILILTVANFKFSRETQLKAAPVVDGIIVSCRPVIFEESNIADVEFKVGSGALRRRSVKLRGKKDCRVGQAVKVQYSTHSNLIELIE